VAALANELIDGFEARGSAELIAAYCTPIPVTVIAELLGVPVEEGPRLVDWSHRMVAMYTPGRNRAVEDSAVAATGEFVAFLRDYVAARRRDPRDDLISHLIAAESAGQKLSEDELIAGTIQLLNAGHEATVHSIGNAVKGILESGFEPATLFSSNESTAAACEEALRFDPPLHFFDRYALEDVEVEGVRLRKGEKIGLILAAANRDPSRWEHAGRFDPSRLLLPNISFGAGIHFCIGAPLARLKCRWRCRFFFSSVCQGCACRGAAVPQRLAFPRAGGALRGLVMRGHLLPRNPDAFPGCTCRRSREHPTWAERVWVRGVKRQSEAGQGVSL
jgi:cytochrome P450